MNASLKRTLLGIVYELIYTLENNQSSGASRAFGVQLIK